ncbi:MAG: LysM peptidoglycan-binding domain-containing protein [Verrucomicrobiota bacterium]
MRTPWLVGAIVLVHCMAVGIVLLMPGCGTPGQTGPRPGSTVEEEVILPPRPADESEPQAGKEPSASETRSEVRSWPQETSMYVVAKGDSLSGIAARFDISIKKLMALNGITNADVIKTGQTLVIPAEADTQDPPVRPETRESGTEDGGPVAGGKYVVQKGDTLSEIAADHDTTVQAIKRANNLKSDMIRVGQKLMIPGMEEAGGVDEGQVESTEPEEEKSERRIEPVDLQPEPAETVSVPPEVETGKQENVESGDTRIHIVGAGEDLKTIAMLWGASAEKLRELNDLGKDEKVEPGDRIKVPMPKY